MVGQHDVTMTWGEASLALELAGSDAGLPVFAAGVGVADQLAFRRRQAGALVGAIAGPVGITLGSVSGAILGGLAGGVGGCGLGAQLGESLDRHVLANNLCLACNHRFNLPA